MAYNYNRAATRLKKMLVKYGVPFDCTRPSVGDYNPEDGKVVSKLPIKYVARMVPMDVTEEDLAGDSVLKTDLKFLSSFQDHKVGDTVVVDCKPHRLVKAKPIRGGDLILGYFVFVRV